MAAVERIGCPEGGHHRGVVEVGVVALTCVVGVDDILASFKSGRQFEPILVHSRVTCAARHSEKFGVRSPAVSSAGRKSSSPRHNGVGLEHIDLTWREAAECGCESAVVPVSIAGVG